MTNAAIYRGAFRPRTARLSPALATASLKRPSWSRKHGLRSVLDVFWKSQMVNRHGQKRRDYKMPQRDIHECETSQRLFLKSVFARFFLQVFVGIGGFWTVIKHFRRFLGNVCCALGVILEFGINAESDWFKAKNNRGPQQHRYMRISQVKQASSGP